MIDKMERKEMYYDSFANEYVKEIEDLNAPPERYLLTLRGLDNHTYIEVHENMDDKTRLDIAYSKYDLESKLVNRIRFAEYDRHNFNWQRAIIIRWTIPQDLFDKYWKRFIETADEDGE